MRLSECRAEACAENPGGIVRRRLVGIVSSEVERALIIREGRGCDRPRRHQRLPRCRRSGDLSQVIAPARIPDQIPPTSIEPAVTDIDDAMPAWHRRSRRDERLETDEQQVSALIIVDLCHVVVGGNDITRPRLPLVAEKSLEIEFGGLAAVVRVDTDDAGGIAFDGREQHFAATRGARDRCQAAQAGFGAARMRIGVNEAPMRRGPVDPLVDLLSDRRVEATVAFSEAADAQPTGEAGERARRDARDVQLRRGAPTNATGDVRVIAAAEDAPRILPGEDEVDSGLSIAMRAEAADLRQKIRRWAILCERYRGPGASRVVATEHPRRAGQVPGGGDQERHRLGQARAGAVGRKADLAQCRDGKVARTPTRHPLIEGMIDSPARAGSVENEDLRALQPLRARSILPIAIAGIELAVVTGEEANLGAANEVTGTIPRACREGELKFVAIGR